ncbi:hypothetical protein EG329_004876 [Mollisiaceae sp. DMI_Dod_QoI]|nr:hypothetical protein EG329_004876 [Helotiales sp. DMI_Dod_QoI]
MDGLWGRRANTNKLSLSTSTTNGGPLNNDHPTRGFPLGRRTTDTSSHSNKNPFGAMSPSTTSLASPTAGASNAFGLGSGAFAAFGSSKIPKTPGGGLDYSSVIGSSAKTPTAEKQLKDISSKTSRASLTESKTATQSAAHHLRHSWAFWFRPPISKSNGFVEYEKTLHETGGFDTVEDFWKVYSRLARPSTLPLVSDYHIFKRGIRPVWEDDENKKGGKWIVRLKKGVADRYWEELVLAIVGDQFAEASEELCGAVLSVRNGEDILSIWTRNDGGRVLKIRETMKRMLNFPPETKVEWKSHDASMAQRIAIDEQRKEKSNQRNGNKDNEHASTPISDKKQNA